MDSTPSDLVKKTAALARLRVDDAEAEELGRDFTRILQAFEGLTGLDVANVEPMVGGPGGTPGLAGAGGPGTTLTDVTRADEPRPGLERDRVLGCAPDARDGFYAVPKTIGGDG